MIRKDKSQSIWEAFKGQMTDSYKGKETERTVSSY